VDPQTITILYVALALASAGTLIYTTIRRQLSLALLTLPVIGAIGYLAHPSTALTSLTAPFAAGAVAILVYLGIFGLTINETLEDEHLPGIRAVGLVILAVPAVTLAGSHDGGAIDDTRWAVGILAADTTDVEELPALATAAADVFGTEVASIVPAGQDRAEITFRSTNTHPTSACVTLHVGAGAGDNCHVATDPGRLAKLAQLGIDNPATDIDADDVARWEAALAQTGGR